MRDRSFRSGPMPNGTTDRPRRGRRSSADEGRRRRRAATAARSGRRWRESALIMPAAPASASRSASTGRSRWVAAIDHAAAGADGAAIRRPSMRSAAASSAVSRLVEKPDRPVARAEAGRSPRGASARPRGPRPADRRVPPSPTASSASLRCRRCRPPGARQNARFSARREGRLQRVEMAEIVDPPADPVFRRPDSERRACRPPAAGSPAIRRSSVDLPAPFGPVTARSSPSATANDTPAKTGRPPRSAARPAADSAARAGPASC